MSLDMSLLTDAHALSDLLLTDATNLSDVISEIRETESVVGELVNHFSYDSEMMDKAFSAPAVCMERPPSAQLPLSAQLRLEALLSRKMEQMEEAHITKLVKEEPATKLGQTAAEIKVADGEAHPTKQERLTQNLFTGLLTAPLQQNNFVLQNVQNNFVQQNNFGSGSSHQGSIVDLLSNFYSGDASPQHADQIYMRGTTDTATSGHGYNGTYGTCSHDTQDNNGMKQQYNIGVSANYSGSSFAVNSSFRTSLTLPPINEIQPGSTNALINSLIISSMGANNMNNMNTNVSIHMHANKNTNGNATNNNGMTVHMPSSSSTNFHVDAKNRNTNLPSNTNSDNTNFPSPRNWTECFRPKQAFTGGFSGFGFANFADRNTSVNFADRNTSVNTNPDSDKVVGEVASEIAPKFSDLLEHNPRQSPRHSGAGCDCCGKMVCIRGPPTQFQPAAGSSHCNPCDAYSNSPTLSAGRATLLQRRLEFHPSPRLDPVLQCLEDQEDLVGKRGQQKCRHHIEGFTWHTFSRAHTHSGAGRLCDNCGVGVGKACYLCNGCGVKVCYQCRHNERIDCQKEPEPCRHHAAGFEWYIFSRPRTAHGHPRCCDHCHVEVGWECYVCKGCGLKACYHCRHHEKIK